MAFPLDTADLLGASPIPGDYTIAGGPRISPGLFHEVLMLPGSPAAAENASDALYAILISYGLDPGVALAFFQHESTYGTRGLAVQTRSWGNQRRSPSGRGTVKTIPGRGPFAHFSTWADSLHDWCIILIGPVYRGAGLITVGQVIPVYAPSSDNNRPASYIAAVVRAVTAWERLSRAAGWLPPGEADPWASWGTAYPLDSQQRTFAIPRAWRAARSLGRATGPEVALAPNRAAQAFEHGVIVWFGGDRTEVIR